MLNKPFSESCEQNKEPILSIIKFWFTQPGETVFEIGSGTGQHACYFPKSLNQLLWQPSDQQANLDGIEAWRAEANLDNVMPALVLDVSQPHWPVQTANYIFSANTVHIMSWGKVQDMFKGIRAILKPKGIFCLYGPFKYHEQFTSPSNAQFDQWLKSRDPLSGIRDFESLCQLGDKPSTSAPLQLIEDHAMPANNRILVFQSQEELPK